MCCVIADLDLTTNALDARARHLPSAVLISEQRLSERRRISVWATHSGSADRMLRCISQQKLLGHAMNQRFGATVSILVVEDDEAVAELIRAVLNDEVGWGATVVHDAAAAREVFRHVRVEVLVLDVNLPGISGIELLPLLRQDAHWNEPPIILMSAAPEQSAVVDAVRDGLVTTLIRKPFDVDALVDEIRRTVNNLRP